MINKIKALLSYRIPKIPINSQRAFNLVDIFISAMDQPFFLEAQKKKSHITGEVEFTHPLLNSLSKCEGKILETDLLLAEILELGLYIEAFAQDRNIGFCLGNLKSCNQYHSTFYQLAMGFRLAKMGCKVYLEPETDRGRSDLFYEYKDNKYIAECYRIHKTFFDYIGDFESNLHENIFAAADKNKSFNFYLKLNAPITFHSMRQLRKRYFELLAEFENDASLKAKEVEINGNRIGIEDITLVQNDPPRRKFMQMEIAQKLEFLDCESCWASSKMQVKNAFESVGSSDKAINRQHFFFIWHNFPKQGLKDPYDILISNLSNKLKQTKSTKELAKRVLFAHLPFGVDKSKKNSDKQIDIIKNASRNFENIFAIVLTNRQLQNTNRFMYNGVFISPKPNNEVDEFIKSFREIENSDFFL